MFDGERDELRQEIKVAERDRDFMPILLLGAALIFGWFQGEIISQVTYRDFFVGLVGFALIREVLTVKVLVLRRFLRETPR